MTDKEKFDAGYKYAQQENAALANAYHGPVDPGALANDSWWKRGYERFHEALDQAP